MSLENKTHEKKRRRGGKFHQRSVMQDEERMGKNFRREGKKKRTQSDQGPGPKRKKSVAKSTATKSQSQLRGMHGSLPIEEGKKKVGKGSNRSKLVKREDALRSQ